MHFFKHTSLLLALLLLGGCTTSRSLVVLLPDQEGKVGEIHFESDRGTEVVNEAYRAAANSSLFFAAQAPQTFSREEVESTFGAALAREPEQRYRFEKQIFYFQLNSTTMVPSSGARLQQAAQYLQDSSPLAIYVVGHADRSGSEQYNRRLSQQRAISVRQALVDFGVTDKIITISHLGESRPAVMTPDDVAEPQNRRAELVLQYQRRKDNGPD